MTVGLSPRSRTQGSDDLTTSVWHGWLILRPKCEEEASVHSRFRNCTAQARHRPPHRKGARDRPDGPVTRLYRSAYGASQATSSLTPFVFAPTEVRFRSLV